MMARRPAIALIGAALPQLISCSDTTYELPAQCNQGVIYADGRELSPPYLFTGIGADTLYLNGVPFEPQRRSAARAALQADLDNPSPLVVEVAQRMDAIEKNVAARHATASRKGKQLSRGERVAIAKQVIEEYDAAHHNVESIETGIGSVTYKFVDFPGQLSLLYENVTATKIPRKRTQAEQHRSRIEVVEGNIALGGILAFGDAYHLYWPPTQRSRALAAIATFRRNPSAPFPPQEYERTILEEPDFRRDLREVAVP